MHQLEMKMSFYKFTAKSADDPRITDVVGTALSDYQDVVVVDAGGSGDYETLGTAYAAEGNDKTYVIFGTTTESGEITITGEVVVFGVNGIVNESIQINNGATLILRGDLNMTSAIYVGEYHIGGGTLDMAVRMSNGIYADMGDAANLNTVILRATANIERATSTAITINGGSTGAVMLRIDAGARIVTAGNTAIAIGGSGGVAGIDVVNSLIHGAFVSGAVNAIVSDFDISPAVYQCLLVGGVSANVTLPVGGGNVSV